jgi:hypothetical protein
MLGHPRASHLFHREWCASAGGEEGKVSIAGDSPRVVIYLLYNGTLADKSVDDANLLTNETLTHLLP